MSDKTGNAALAGGALAAVTASACCLGPLVLVMLGIGGAWIANLTALAPYRPVFAGIAVAFLVFAYRRIYRPAGGGVCAPDAVCASPRIGRLYKISFWSVSALVLVAIAFPYAAPIFY